MYILWLWLISISVYLPVFSVLATFQSCSNVECWTLECNVGVLEKGTSAILKVRSRIWGETFNAVSFSKDMQKSLFTLLYKAIPIIQAI